MIPDFLWFTKHPADILKTFGITTERRRAEELESLFDGSLSGYYYVAAASDGTDEAIKWIMGAVAAFLNEQKLPFPAVHRVMPSDYLRTFIEYLKTNKFEKGFAKDVFAELLKADQHVDVDLNEMTPTEMDVLVKEDHWTHRRTGPEVLDKIISNPRFKVADSSEIDTIIDGVIAANADKAAKVAEQPQLVQWFVG